MKIALYVHCFFPTHFYGTEAYTLTLAKELTALGRLRDRLGDAVGRVRPGRARGVYSYDGLQVVSIDKNLYPNRRVRDTYEQPALRMSTSACCASLSSTSCTSAI